MKVCKFGGSSLADAAQVNKVIDIVLADPARRIVVVSAPGKRHSGDTKVTDLLIALAETALKGDNTDREFGEVAERYASMADALKLGAGMQFTTSLRTIGEDMRAFRPTLLMAVPLLAEKLLVHAGRFGHSISIKEYGCLRLHVHFLCRIFPLHHTERYVRIDLHESYLFAYNERDIMTSIAATETPCREAKYTYEQGYEHIRFVLL